MKVKLTLEYIREATEEDFKYLLKSVEESDTIALDDFFDIYYPDEQEIELA